MLNRVTATIALVVLSLAFAPKARAQTAPPTSRWVEIGKPHLGKRGNSIVLVQTIRSTASKEKLWAIVDVNGPDQTPACDWLKPLEPNEPYRFECPLKNPGGQQYALRVRVFKDARLTDRELLYEPVLDITPQQLTEARSIPGAEAAVPIGTFEGIVAPLPVTIKTVWYRRLDKGFGMKAYEMSGDLTVSADQLNFVDGKKTVTVPKARILSVRWEPAPRDIANHWVVVRFTNDEGKADGVAFRDGARLGNRGDTGPIYQAVRQIKK